MDQWKKTSCVLCMQNCGLEVKVVNNRITKVRGDSENPRSQGYACRKGLKIADFQHHDDRLTHPLKKTDQGFVPISWDQAYKEIGEKLKGIVDRHGPRAFALNGFGAMWCHFEAAFGRALMEGLGSKYHYNPQAQELTGFFWVCGNMLGRQNRFPIPDEHAADMVLAAGWNGMVSHQVPRAPIFLKEFAKNPDKLLAVIDPRLSETARTANIHIPLRPGTDALLVRSMIALILQEGWENTKYIKKHTRGFEKIRCQFENFDIHGALAVCQVGYQAVYELCKELSRRKWCMHFDLGVMMNRHSTLSTWLYLLLAAVCGRLCVPGGNVIPGVVHPLGYHNEEGHPDTWRTLATDFPAIMGFHPPNVLPEEILSEHPQRIRALINSSSNPLRSYADTRAFENAFERLELLVTVEVAMTETAEMSDYVLPGRTAFECYDTTFFAKSYPEVYFQMRQPVVTPHPDTRDNGEIFIGIAEHAGVMPEIPDYLFQAAEKGLDDYTAALGAYFVKTRTPIPILPMVLGKTLGPQLGSVSLAALWGHLFSAPRGFRKHTVGAGYPIPSVTETLRMPGKLSRAFSRTFRYMNPGAFAVLAPQAAHAKILYEALMAHPEGMWIGKVNPNKNMAQVRTPDKKIQLFDPQMSGWLQEITPDLEKKDLELMPEFPFVLNAGRHKPENANNIMRNPVWNKGRRTCTLAMNPIDAEKLEMIDKEIVRVCTETGFEELELEISKDVRKGQVLVPHGFGLKYNGKVHGINVNRLCRNTHRDRIAATPLHRFVPCRVEKVGN